MASLLEQLENNEAVLLMYLAGELPDEDRAEVEQQLARDAALRQELEQLQAAHVAAMEAMQDSDEVSVTAKSQEASLAKVSRMMRQWQVDRVRSQPVEVPQKVQSTGWWMYPVAAAAAAVIVLVIWTTRSVSPLPVESQVADTTVIFGSDPLQDGHLKDVERQLALLAGTSQDIPTMFPND